MPNLNKPPENIVDLDVLHENPVAMGAPGPLPFRSETCSSSHFLYYCYGYWCHRLKEEQPEFHRKQWEFVYIAQALWERGLLRDGTRGLGFGIGREPLGALFASMGCTIVATDQEDGTNWAASGQHAGDIGDLNGRNICPTADFDKLVSFRPVDMNDIPSDLRDFDFCWSACSFEHLGSIEKGLNFFVNSLETLKPGGCAIHTTEFNLSSNTDTIENVDLVLFRYRDIKRLVDRLNSAGHRVEPLLVHTGSQPVDGYVDIPPSSGDPHLKLQIGQFTTTSIGIIAVRHLNA